MDGCSWYGPRCVLQVCQLFYISVLQVTWTFAVHQNNSKTHDSIVTFQNYMHIDLRGLRMNLEYHNWLEDFTDCQWIIGDKYSIIMKYAYLLCCKSNNQNIDNPTCAHTHHKNNMSGVIFFFADVVSFCLASCCHSFFPKWHTLVTPVLPFSKIKVTLETEL